MLLCPDIHLELYLHFVLLHTLFCVALQGHYKCNQLAITPSLQRCRQRGWIAILVKLTILGVGFLVLVVAALLEDASASGECPTVSQVYSCNPSCLQDSDCSYGKKCCENSCHTKSCVEGKTQGSSGSKGSSGGSGTYCNNVKCNSYEKCALDKSSKRMKCVRA